MFNGDCTFNRDHRVYSFNRDKRVIEFEALKQKSAVPSRIFKTAMSKLS